jgi:hypothetical protein
MKDKLKFTLEFQLIKATEDLLAEALASGYEGYVKIIASLKSNKDDKVLLDVAIKRLGKDKPKGSVQNKTVTEVVFHIAQGKGAKRVDV